MSSQDGFDLFQQHVATRLGVAEEVVRKLRKEHLREGEDFVREGNRIRYSAAAAARLMELLHVPPVVLEAPSLRPLKAWVVRPRVNPRFVEARLMDGALIEVRVRDNRLLVPGMVMECTETDGVFVCAKVPRRKGAW